MRGSPSALAICALSEGIIPAHAGLTCRRSGWPKCQRDHPRACGAHVPFFSTAAMASGSSPRMRGSLFEPVQQLSVAGIIPAHAGLTDFPVVQRCINRDHPRACGAHALDGRNGRLHTGSSPRMRGSPSRNMIRATFRRIIPAHAGLTLRQNRLPCRPRDHPRACGAHLCYTYKEAVKAGSSPRMRGSLAEFFRADQLLGIIPAHAGLT